MDDLFKGEATLDDVEDNYNIPGIGTMRIKFLDTKFLIDGIAHFRPYIRAFFVFLLWLYNIRMFMSFINQDAGIAAGMAARASRNGGGEES